MRWLAFAMALLAAACSSDDPATCGDASSCPAGMTLVSASCGSFCIDSTEVTRDQYAQFLGQAPAPGGQPEPCAWNQSFEPSCPLGEVPGNDPNLPITCVDWCDAGAYCAWAGKRLCTLEHRNSPGLWDTACLATFGHLDADPPGCNLHSGAMKPVGTSVGCSGKNPPLDGLFDLIGNAAEWTDDCVAGFDEGVVYCAALGASAFNGDTVCGSGVTFEPTYRDPFVGFRCCGP